MSAMRLYRASDQLIRNRELIEQGLFSRIEDMFSLETTVTLYDLTNTCFEGDAACNRIIREAPILTVKGGSLE